jgi:hypothetical protein
MAGELTGNSQIFSTSNPISARALTSAKVAHDSNELWNASSWYNLNDISNVVQEIVNRSDWNQGNSLSIIMKGTGGSWGRKFIKSFGAGASNAPTLIIVYTK